METEKDGIFFKNQDGNPLPTVSHKDYQNLITKLSTDFGISELQLVESTGFSMAMVIRAALGYSAAEANILAIISDNLESRSILATLRHLVTAHANAEIISVGALSKETSSLLNPLIKMGINVTEIATKTEARKLTEFLADAHNVLFGLNESNELNNALVALLNDNQTPIHCLNCPYGVNPDDGSITKPVLYASSTLSLGCLQTGLLIANEYCGRNYLCDLSIPEELYTAINCPNLGLNFAAQPVIRVLYHEEAENK